MFFFFNNIGFLLKYIRVLRPEIYSKQRKATGNVVMISKGTNVRTNLVNEELYTLPIDWHYFSINKF